MEPLASHDAGRRLARKSRPANRGGEFMRWKRGEVLAPTVDLIWFRECFSPATRESDQTPLQAAV